MSIETKVWWQWCYFRCFLLFSLFLINWKWASRAYFPGQSNLCQIKYSPSSMMSNVCWVRKTERDLLLKQLGMLVMKESFLYFLKYVIFTTIRPIQASKVKFGVSWIEAVFNNPSEKRIDILDCNYTNLV